MKFSKNISKKVALFMVALMLSIIPNLEVYSAVGNYQNQSSALKANRGFALDSDGNASGYFTVSSLVAVAVYIAYSTNAISDYSDYSDSNSTSGETDEILGHRSQRKSTDFSQFDN